jgi:hypothetical protein
LLEHYPPLGKRHQLLSLVLLHTRSLALDGGDLLSASDGAPASRELASPCPDASAPSPVPPSCTEPSPPCEETSSPLVGLPCSAVTQGAGSRRGSPRLMFEAKALSPWARRRRDGKVSVALATLGADFSLLEDSDPQIGVDAFEPRIARQKNVLI